MPLTTTKRSKIKMFDALAGFSLVPCLGIMCFRLSAWTMFQSDLGYADPDFSFAARIMQIFAIVLLLILDRRVPYTGKHATKMIVAGSAALSVGAALVVLSGISAACPTSVAYLGGAIHGAASGIVILGWGFCLASMETRKSAFALTLAFALYGLFTWILGGVTSIVIIVMMLVTPIISCICLIWGFEASCALSVAETKPEKSTLRELPWGIFIILLICVIASILAKILAPPDVVSASSDYRIYWPLIFVFIFIVFYVWIFVLKRDDTDKLWPVFVLVIFSGLLCYSSFSATRSEFAAGFFQATQACLMLFCWTTFTDLIYRHNLPRVLFFGLGTLVFLEPPTLFAGLYGVLVPSSGIPQGDGTATIAVTSVTALVLVILTVVFMSRRASSAAESSTDSVEDSKGIAEDTLRKAAEELARDYDLTPRETEVAVVLARGYTLPQIAEKLFISIDTVRSHTKHIYRKLNIHEKRMLIDLIEEKRLVLRQE